MNWRSAEMVLERVRNDRQRSALATLVRELGVHGSAGLNFAARTACYLSGARGELPERRRTLTPGDAEWIEARVRRELAALVKVDPKLWPKAQKSLAARTADVVPITAAQRA